MNKNPICSILQNQYFETTLPPHATRIYRLEAEERNERTKYEAETAWLSAYQELEENLTPPTATYEENPQASGEMIVSNLGHNPNNDLQWREVYSKNGGKYIMQLNYISQKESHQTVCLFAELRSMQPHCCARSLFSPVAQPQASVPPITFL